MASINHNFSKLTQLLARAVLVLIVFGVVGVTLVTAPAAHAETDSSLSWLAPIVFGPVTGAFLSTQSSTDCGSGISVITCGIGKGIASLLNVVSDLAGWLIHFLADGIVLLLDYSARIVDMPAVQAGFQVSLSIVNIVFVMALIITAFEIILGYHEGEAKKRLAKVIIAAVLINFSFLFAGFLLDISNVFTNFFVSSVTSDNLRIALRPEQLQAMHQLSATASGGFFDTIAPMLFKLLISGIMLVILISVFATVLVRILWVACLLLVMPLSWSFWVFPGLEKYHSQWWSEFMKWGVTMMPTIVFFMYIGIQTVGQMSAWAGRGPVAATSILDTLQGVVQMLIIGGIMVAGLKIGQSAGAISASAALGIAGKATNLATKPLYNKYTKRWIARPAAGKMASAISKLAAQPFYKGGLIGKGLVASGLASTAAQYSHQDHDLEAGMKKQYEGMGVSDRVKIAMNASTPTGRAEAFLALKEKGDLAFKEMLKKDGGAEKLVSLMQAYGGLTHNDTNDLVKSIPGLKKVLGANPEVLAMAKAREAVANDSSKNYQDEYEKQLTDAYQKMQTSDLKEIDLEAVIKDPVRSERFTSSLSGQQLSQAARKNGQAQVLVRYSTIKSLIAATPTTGEAAIDNEMKALQRSNEALKAAIDGGKQDDIIKLSADISKKMESIQENISRAAADRPADFAKAQSLANKFDKVDNITGMLGEITSSGDADKK